MEMIHYQAFTNSLVPEGSINSPFEIEELFLQMVYPADLLKARAVSRLFRDMVEHIWDWKTLFTSRTVPPLGVPSRPISFVSYVSFIKLNGLTVTEMLTLKQMSIDISSRRLTAWIVWSDEIYKRIDRNDALSKIMWLKEWHQPLNQLYLSQKTREAQFDCSIEA